MNKYYAAFDFENKRVGLALAVEDSDDTCHADQNLDLSNHQQEEIVETTGAPSTFPTQAPVETASPTLAPKEETFDFSGVPQDEINDETQASTPVAAPSPTQSNLSNNNSIRKSNVDTSSADPIALLLGFGVGFVAIALLLFRRRQIRQKQRIDAILRHAEANSPYRDNDNNNSYSDDQQQHQQHRETFVEIDLQTLHRMN